MERYDRFYVKTKSDGKYENKHKTLLVVIDEQPKLMVAMEGGEEAVLTTIALVDTFKKYGMHIVATEQDPKGLGETDERIRFALSKEGIFEKTSFDGLIPELECYIDHHHIKNVVIAGAEAHVCVYQTVRSLLTKGVNVFVAEDAVASGSDHLKARALKTMEAMGALVVNTEMVLFDIAGDSKDNNFKFVSDTVKGLRNRD